MNIPSGRLAALAMTMTLGIVAQNRGNAADLYPWNNHARPYDFLFNDGTEIDTHQQTLINQATKELSGFLYIEFTGAVSKDGYRVASHTDCNAAGATCTVGWNLRGQRATATLVYHVEPDHPTWLIDRADIPQPGSYSHFHWSDTSQHPVVGSTHDGYMLQLQAVDTFCFVNGDPAAFQASRKCEDDANQGVIVRPGIDVATHVNIVGSYPGFAAP